MEAVHEPISKNDPLSAQALPPIPPTGHTAADGAEDAEVAGAAAPAIVRSLAFRHFLGSFLEQFAPVGAFEDFLVRDLARQAAHMETWSSGLDAVMARQVHVVAHLALIGGADTPSDDATTAAAVSGASVEAVDRRLRAHTAAFHRTLRSLLDAQGRRQQRGERRAASGVLARFENEEACQRHLLQRLQSGRVACRSCGATAGHYLPSRTVWECAGCKRQTGLRVGTVAARSPLPLRTWFRAILRVLEHPMVKAAELAEELAIERVETVRMIIRRIHSAMASEKASEWLAGLDHVVLEIGPATPEPSAENRSEARGGNLATVLAPATRARHEPSKGSDAWRCVGNAGDRT